MKTLIVVASFILLGGWMGQAPSTPPVKMGLWEVSTTSKVLVGSLPPDKATAHTTNYRACRTLDTYQNWFAGTAEEKCAFRNIVWTSSSYKADFSCEDRRGHVDVTFDSSTATRSTVHITMPATEKRPVMEVDATSTGKFIGPDCGTVTPDKIEIMP